MTHEANCPYCKKYIELPVERWNTEEACPQCGVVIYIQFDFIVLENEDELDIYEFKLFP